MEIVEILDKRERRTWMHKFAKSYSGETRPINKQMISETVRFFFAIENGKKIGFLRCVDKSMHFNLPPRSVFSASDAYVLPEYRSQGILKKLLVYAIQVSKVEMLNIELSRYLTHRAYYRNLGFIKTNTIENSLIWVFREKFFNSHFETDENIPNLLDEEHKDLLKEILSFLNK